jgi:serine/threonine protein kinase
MTTETTPELEGVPSRLGRYQLVYRLASGGMASVWLARALGSDGFEKVVAVKTIHSHLKDEASTVRMFIDEARIAAAISHPNVCQVFDFGEESGVHYLVMDYLVGESLSRVLRRLARPGAAAFDEVVPGMVARIIADAAEGLHAAHELRDQHGRSLEVVHRDVSPQNIFVTYDGVVKVVDFGIARARAKLERTTQGVFKGKFEYAAPEQIRTETIDRRVDIWALGVCLWELLARKSLFLRDSVASTMNAVTEDCAPPPSSVRRGVPASLDAIVGRALERDVERRYQTARELSRALRGWLAESRLTVDAAEVGEWMTQLFPVDRLKRLALSQGRESFPREPTAVPPSLVVTNTPGPQETLDLPEDDPNPAPSAQPPSRLPVLVVAALVMLGVVGAAALWRLSRANSVPAPSSRDAGAARRGPAVQLPADDAGRAPASRPAPMEPETTRPEQGPPSHPDVAPSSAKPPSPSPSPSPTPTPTPSIQIPSPPQSPRPPAPLRRDAGPEGPVGRGRGTARAGVGWASIKGPPRAYQIFIDGRRVGVTPLQVELGVGMHRIELRTPGETRGFERLLMVEHAVEYTIDVK